MKKYVLIEWPDSQKHMEKDWFKNEAYPGPNASYFIPVERIEKIQYRIYKNNKGDWAPYVVSKGNNAKEAIKKALDEIIRPEFHKGTWLATPREETTIKNKYFV